MKLTAEQERKANNVLAGHKMAGLDTPSELVDLVRRTVAGVVDADAASREIEELVRRQRARRAV